MKTPRFTLPLRATVLTLALACVPPTLFGVSKNPGTDFMANGSYGIFQHIAVGTGKDTAWANSWTQDIDVNAIAQQVKDSGANWYMLPLMNSEYFNGRSSAWDRIIGNSSYTVERDLIRDMGNAMRAKGIVFGVYFPADMKCYTDHLPEWMQTKLGWDTVNNRSTTTYKNNLESILREFAEDYKDIVDFVWIDAAGTNRGFPDWTQDSSVHSYAIRRPFQDNGIVFCINPGAFRAFDTAYMASWLMDYVAGEVGNPLAVTLPTSRWIKNIQWHNLCHLGTNWSKDDTTHTVQSWADYLNAVKAVKGAVTISVSFSGANKRIGDQQFNFLKQVKAKLSTGTGSGGSGGTGGSTDLRVTSVSGGLKLEWDAYTGADITNYRVYRNGSAINWWVKKDATSYTDTSVTNGTHDYEVWAWDNDAGDKILLKKYTARVTYPL